MRFVDLDQVNVTAVAVVPDTRERTGKANLVARREEEQLRPRTVRNPQVAQSLHHRPSARVVSRDGQNTESLPPEVPLVLACGMHGEIGAHLAAEAGLPDITALDWHGSAIDLHHEAAAGAILKPEAEHEIGRDTDLVYKASMPDCYAQDKWRCRAERLIRE